MDYKELAERELRQIRMSVNMLILNMQEIASLQKLRMMQEFKHSVDGFGRTVIAMVEDHEKEAVGGKKVISSATLAD